LEKGCQHKCGGSITILPIVETRGGDITNYISTNIISITDGQIVLSKKSFDKGEKPAINYGLSVSRLGGAVQTGPMKKLGAQVRRELLSYLETREVYELANTDEMGKELQDRLKRGAKLLKGLGQYKYSPMSQTEIIGRFESIYSEE
jgi:F-type H+-transporting ATPase subunit alpha